MQTYKLLCNLMNAALLLKVAGKARFSGKGIMYGILLAVQQVEVDECGSGWAISMDEK